jgi:hypothetical protein
VDSNSVSLTNGDPFIVPTSVSGNADSSLLPPSGPSPHLILRTSEIAEQRLRKKIRRLITQRDHWKSEYDKLHYILRVFPYRLAEKDHKRSMETSEKLERLAHYETMVPLVVSENERLKEQIRILTQIDKTP